MKTTFLHDRLSDIDTASVCIVGDLMLDHYCVGEVSRISPEAPVPVIAVSEEHHQLGGAGNVARNITKLGAQAHLCSVVGNDEAGSKVQGLVETSGITSHIVSSPNRPTTLKSRVISQNQQMIRIDREVSTALSTSDEGTLLSTIAKLLPKCRILILSDYGKGVISPSFYSGLLHILRDQPSVLLLIDPKIRNFPVYTNPFILTPNRKELFEGANMYPSDDITDIIRAGLSIFKSTKTQHLLVTLGPNGMALFESPDSIYHIPTFAQKVYDVTGAGDTVIAVMGVCLAAGFSLLESCILSNYAAGIVVGEVGAASVSRETLSQTLQDSKNINIQKWLG